MILKKEHIIFKILTFLLVLSLFVPATIKLAHVFEHHKHEVCKDDTTTHIHKVDLDCEFQKFNLNLNSPLVVNYVELFEITSPYTLPFLTYATPYNHKQTALNLRGPPTIV